MEIKVYATLDTDQLTEEMMYKIRSMEGAVTAAMADELWRIVDGNFGAFGIERPFDWPDLTPAYARRVKRNFPTLEVTGKLRAAVIREYSATTARVYLNNDQVPYAMAQMRGYPPRNLPARTAFPFDSAGECLPFTAASVTNAAEEKLEELLRGTG